MIDLTHVWGPLNDGLLILLQGLALVIGGYLVYALHKYGRFLSAAQQAKLASVIDQGLNAAVQYAMNAAAVEEAKVKPTTDSLVVRIGAQYAANHFGGTLEKMGKSPADIAQMILARLPTPPTDADLTGAKIPGPLAIETNSLPPIGA